MISYNYLGEKFNNKYPYMYRIDLTGWQLAAYEQLLDWIKEVSLPCTIAGSGLYVKDEQAVSHVMLRWAS